MSEQAPTPEDANVEPEGQEEDPNYTPEDQPVEGEDPYYEEEPSDG